VTLALLRTEPGFAQDSLDPTQGSQKPTVHVEMVSPSEMCHVS
jgi:hypothetical protein